MIFSHARNSTENSRQCLPNKTGVVVYTNHVGQKYFRVLGVCGRILCGSMHFCSTPCSASLKKTVLYPKAFSYCVLYTPEVFSRLCLRTCGLPDKMIAQQHWSIVLQLVYARGY